MILMCLPGDTETWVQVNWIASSTALHCYVPLTTVMHLLLNTGGLNKLYFIFYSPYQLESFMCQDMTIFRY